MKLSKKLSEWGLALEDMLWPPRCIACKEMMWQSRQPGTSFCERCWAEMPWIEEHYCLRCGVPLDERNLLGVERICRGCKRRRWQFVWARSVVKHEGLAQELLQRWKLEGEEFLGSSLAQLFVGLEDERLDLLLKEDALLVPIPMDPLRQFWRGYDTAWELARGFAKWRGGTAMRALKRGRYRERQLHLSGGSRRRDWTGVFVLREGATSLVKTRPVILVDDVMTTGSTLNAAAGVLRQAGCPLVVGLSLSREV